MITILAAYKYSTNDYSDIKEVTKSTTIQHNKKDKYYDLIKIAEFTKSQYDFSNLQIGNIIKADNIEEFEADSNIADIFSSDIYYYKAAMQDSDTVVVQNNVIFQSVTGYIATKKDSLDTCGEDYCSLNISPSFGYDSNIVFIRNSCGEYDGWNFYFYIAGL